MIRPTCSSTVSPCSSQTIFQEWLTASAVREIVTGLLAVPEARHAVALELSGIGITYPEVSGRAVDVSAALDGRAVLVGAPAPAGWRDRIEARDGGDPRLVRPDGYVAWAGGPGLETALRRWFGPPRG
jgi:hypothetical protein